MTAQASVDELVRDAFLNSCGRNALEKQLAYDAIADLEGVASSTSGGPYRHFLESCREFQKHKGLLSIQHLERSIALVKRSVDVVPDSALFLTEVAYRTSMLNNDASLPWIQRALDSDPSYPRAHSTCGQIALMQGRIDDARRHFEEAEALSPKFHCTRFGMGIVGIIRGEYESARSLFNNILKDFDGNHYARIGIALVFSLCGKVPAALQIVKGVLAEDPNHRPAIDLGIGLSVTLRQLDDVEWFAQTLRDADGETEVLQEYLSLSSCLENPKGLGKAVETVERVSRLQERNSEFADLVCRELLPRYTHE